MSRDNQKQYPPSETKKRFKQLGIKVESEMTPEERESFGSKWNTLHFSGLLGLNSIKTTRNEDRAKMKPVAILLKSDIDIDDVPVINVTLDRDTGIDLEKEIGSRKVKAGEVFCLSYYEFMFLVIRDEYGGFVSYKGLKAVCLQVITVVNSGRDDVESYQFSNIDEDLEFELVEVENSPKGKKRVRLPIPTITFYKGKDENGNSFGFGSIRKKLKAMDEKISGKWVIQDKYTNDYYISRFQKLIDNDEHED